VTWDDIDSGQTDLDTRHNWRYRTHGRPVTRREALGLLGTASLGVLAGCSSGDQVSSSGDQASSSGGVGTELVADGLTAPLGIEFGPGTTEPVYVVDQPGVVRVAGEDGLQSTPFLDVRDRMVSLSGYEERGLLGMAFHPAYPDDRRVFVRYSAPLREGMPEQYSHTFVLSSFDVPDETRTDPESEEVLLEIAEPQGNHNAGSVVFGPDGYLYVGVGDGGGANDVGTGHPADWYDGNAGGNGQNTTTLLGSVLRLDVDDTGPDRRYGVPEDNPLVGGGGRDELFAWGFRNPWRMSFTDGELYVADVGQNRFEEVDLVERGGNYGWNVREGAHCFSTDAPNSPPESCPSETPDGDPLVDPIIEYPHEGPGPSGISVIGGYRYTRGEIAALDDRYVFGDWRSGGTLFTASEPEGDRLWPLETVALQSADGPAPNQFLLSFGRDAEGALYVGTTGNQTPRGKSGRVHRLAPA
jgi:glucose/arabinose dehydrogenase